MFIVKPLPRLKEKDGKTAGTVGLGQWIKSHLITLFIGNNHYLYNGADNQNKTSLSEKMSLFNQALLMTYPCDGYDVTTHTITDFNGVVFPYDGIQSFYRLILSTFFGLPNRPMLYDFLDSKKLKLKVGHILFNFFGGWDLNNYVSIEKAGWQYAAIIVKVLIIFPIKLITWPLKIALNIAKIFTELLPTFLSFICAYAYRRIFFRRAETKNAHLKRMASITLGLLSFLHVLTKIISLIGRAITSPEKSAKLAVAYAHEVRGKLLDIEVGTILGFIAGALSVAVSATLWAVTLPLVLGAATLYFPNAINTLYQTLVSISSLPVIAPTLAILNGITTATVTFLSMVFGPIVMPLASFIGVPVSAALLSIGTGIAVLLLPVATVFSRVADYFSDAWVSWHHAGMFTRWFSAETDIYNKSPSIPTLLDQQRTEMLQQHPSPTRAGHLTSPQPKVTLPSEKLLEEHSAAGTSAFRAVYSAESTIARADSPESPPSKYLTTIPREDYDGHDFDKASDSSSDKSL